MMDCMNDLGRRERCWNSTGRRWIAIGGKLSTDHSGHWQPELTGMDHMNCSLKKQLREDMMNS